MLRNRPLGWTGIEVTELGFGAWAIAGEKYGPVDEAQGRATVEAYLAAGGNFIDTARAYGKGQSERLVGQVLQSMARREDVVLATKTQKTGDAESIPQIREELEASLRALGTDYVDVYFMHRPPSDPDVLEQALEVFEALREEDKIRVIAASIRGAAVTDETAAMCRQYIRTGRIGAIQLIYSIVRQKNAEIFDEAESAGVGLVARTALESGLLTGKYMPGTHFDPPDHRTRWNGAPADYITVQARYLAEHAVAPPDQSVSELALRFALAPSAVSTVIVGGKTPEQVQRNLAVADDPPLDDQTLDWLRRTYGNVTESCNPGP